MENNQLLMDLAKELKVIKSILRDNPQQKEWLTTQEAMELLQVGETTIWSYKKNGILSFSKIGRRNYFNRNDIGKLLDSKKKNALSKNNGMSANENKYSEPDPFSDNVK
ncbi:MAG: hypothetical protein COC01_02245 [Bacteroidetes bacterium]|nr:MAG: hypothetical protein COC01_02245 [Bacteroidota bacterium]